MSFSSDVKKEIVRMDRDKKCCILAEIAGFIRMCGSISGEDRNMKLVVATENPASARLILKLIKEYFESNIGLEINQNNTLKKKRIYELHIDSSNKVEQILREIGMLKVKEGENYFPEEISADVIKTRCCKRAFLRGVFLGGGTVSHPEKGYHMEIVTGSEILAKDIKKLINGFGLKSKVFARRSNYIVYLKESEQISDFLALLGAGNQVLEFENIRIIKELRNKTNRIVNCESANLDKTVDSAGRQIDNIKRIDAGMGIDKLPPRLKEVARLRLANPESSLAELGQMLNPPLQKSGVNHRFRKLEEIAGRINS